MKDQNPRSASTSGSAPWRLRTRLALALLFVFVPLAAIVVVSHIENLNDRREARAESVSTIADSLASVVDSFTRDLESFSLSASLAIADRQTPVRQETVGPYLSHLADTYGILRAIFVTDLDGGVLASNSGDSNGTDLSSRSYIQRLQAGAETVWSGAITGSQSGQTTLAFGRTIHSSEGDATGYLIFAFYPTALVGRFPTDLPADANVSLFDEDGITLYTTTGVEGQPDSRSISNVPWFGQLRSGEPVIIESATTPVDTGKRYGAFVPVSRMGWSVGFTRPASVVDGPIEDRIQRDLVIILGVLAAGYVITLFLTHRISRPLSTLAAAAGAIARGEQPQLPQMDADAEVRDLSAAIETMSNAVAERESRLREQAAVLETLERVGETIVTELDLQRAAAAVTKASLELTGAESVVLLRHTAEAGQFEIINTAGLVTTLNADDPLVMRVISSGLLHLSDITAADDHREPRVQIASEESTKPARSFLGMPMSARGGEVLGALVFLHSQPSAFNIYHERLAIGLARRGMAVIENARRYSESREMQDLLRKANVAKDEFLGVISHELRTPITTIYGGAKLLRARLRNLPEDEADEMIASMEEESERLYRLVEDILAIARADLGVPIESEPMAVGPFVERLVHQFANRHSSRPVEAHVSEDLPPVLGEATYFQQVLNNLLSNADKYAGAGTPIDVDVRAADGYVEVRVLDRGPGVPEDELERIFESFYRSNSRTSRASGKGLGLTVCKRLVEVMSGRIWARLREGGGLEVGFALPIAVEIEADIAAAPGANS